MVHCVYAKTLWVNYTVICIWLRCLAELPASVQVATDAESTRQSHRRARELRCVHHRCAQEPRLLRPLPCRPGHGWTVLTNGCLCLSLRGRIKNLGTEVKLSLSAGNHGNYRPEPELGQTN